MAPPEPTPPATPVRLVLTCEHASAFVPASYGGLGLRPGDLAEHIAWDIGAAALTEELAALLGARSVLSTASRLLVDCNRAPEDADLMPHSSHGTVIPGNACIDDRERVHRLAEFYDPFHRAVDKLIGQCPDAMLLSMHSFTPELNGASRPFDVGILHDDFDDVALCVAEHLACAGFATRMNEPYSALDGLIFSARSHGRRHRVPYLELEINNRLLRTERDVGAVARRIAPAIRRVLERVGR